MRYPAIVAVLLALLPGWPIPVFAAQGLDLSVAGVTDSPRDPVGTRSPYAIPEDPDWDGIKRDTYYFVFSQLAVIGVLYALPESISAWSEEQKDDYSLSKWRDNVTEPLVWDEDKWYLNYALHPYWGGVYYVRARERGYGDDEAFWYSFMLSTIYEFGAEAFFETPSVQDMIITPGIGYFVGRYFMHLRNNLRDDLDAGYELGFRDRALLMATDPLGAINQVFDDLLGIDGEYALSPFVADLTHIPLHPHDDNDHPPGHQAGPEIIVPGIHLSMRW